MAVPLYKELGLAYNDPYWYRVHNGLRTLAQATQVRDYYNKPDLPPYGDPTIPTLSTDSAGRRAERAGQQVKDTQPTSSMAMAPNLRVIILAQDTEEDGPDSRSPIPVQKETPTTSTSRDEHQWQQDACNMSEMEYVQKYYAKAVIAWLPMERYQGLCTGQLLHTALLEAGARAQLRPTWKGMEFLDITTLIYPLDGLVCSVTSNRARKSIRTTEAMFFLHPTPMHYNAVLAIKQDMQVTKSFFPPPDHYPNLHHAEIHHFRTNISHSCLFLCNLPYIFIL